MERCIDELVDDNDATPVLVEGLRDERALRELGLRGEIQVYNSGKGMIETAHQLSHTHRRVIVLLDWDRKGGQLVRRLQEQLHAQVELDLDYRKEFALVSGVRSVEDLPSALADITLRAQQTGD
jgi:5S rRNA maturation endonuclease (ribonuclease M5)